MVRLSRASSETRCPPRIRARRGPPHPAPAPGRACARCPSHAPGGWRSACAWRGRGSLGANPGPFAAAKRPVASTETRLAEHPRLYRCRGWAASGTAAAPRERSSHAPAASNTTMPAHHTQRLPRVWGSHWGQLMRHSLPRREHLPTRASSPRGRRPVPCGPSPPANPRAPADSDPPKPPGAGADGSRLPSARNPSCVAPRARPRARIPPGVYFAACTRSRTRRS